MRDAETGTYKIPWVELILTGSDLVVIAWAKRQQGLVVASGNPLGIRTVADRARGLRVVLRQEGAGSRLLLEQLLAKKGYDPEALVYAEGIARTEVDLGL